MRAVLLLAALAGLTACSRESDAIKGDPIACAVGPSAELAPDCRLERRGSGKSARFIVHHPDGGFRRLAVSADGKEIVAADGAQGAKSALVGGAFDVTIGENRYRIPQPLLELSQ